MSKKLIILLGRSASGKTTSEMMLRDLKGFSTLVTYTSREKRPGEKDGIDYHFVSSDFFQKENFQAMFEAKKNWFYGVKLDNLEEGNYIFSVIS
jgi:guanylate kinase